MKIEAGFLMQPVFLKSCLEIDSSYVQAQQRIDLIQRKNCIFAAPKAGGVRTSNDRFKTDKT